MSLRILGEGTAAIALVDVQYEGEGGRSACVLADEFTSASSRAEFVLDHAAVKAYRAGHFFERELPCLIEVLALVAQPLSAIIVDGYVDLDEHGSPGLGAHLFAHLDGKVPVIGVAKRAFRGSGFAAQVLRGESRSPLFVSARGVKLEEAARCVQHMHGEYRIPTLCKRVDQLARGLVEPVGGGLIESAGCEVVDVERFLAGNGGGRDKVGK